MNAFFRPGLIAASAALLIPQPALAAMPSPSPLWTGTWQLNVSASRLSSPAGKRSETWVYGVQGKMRTLKATYTDASGKPSSYSYTAALDGKPYPMVGSPVGDSIALRLVSPLRTDAIVRMGKTVTATGKAKLSADGKHLTLTRKTLHPKAATTLDVLAFDKK